jgi:hypothetical protein
VNQNHKRLRSFRLSRLYKQSNSILQPYFSGESLSEAMALVPVYAGLQILSFPVTAPSHILESDETKRLMSIASCHTHYTVVRQIA